MEENIVAMIEEALREMEEFAQPRSKFALTHFVVGQHDLPARQRKQVLDELQSLFYAINDLMDELEVARIDLEEAEGERPEDDFAMRRLEIKKRGLRRKIWSLELAIKGREREAKILLGILSALPKFSWEDFEAQEAEYWRRRLTRQYVELQLGGGGNLSAMVEAISELGKPMALLPGQEEWINQFKAIGGKYAGGNSKLIADGGGNAGPGDSKSPAE